MSVFSILRFLSVLLSPSSLLCICLPMSYSHCISSILSDFVCVFCRSLSFLRQFFPYFVFLCRCFRVLRHCCVFACRCIFSTVFRQFSPSLFAFSVILSLSYVSPFLLCFVSRCFSSLRHFSIFVSRCRIPTVYRQFSPTLFANSVALCLCYVSSFLTLSFSVVLSPSYVTTVYLSFAVVFFTVFRQFSPFLFAFSVILFLSYVSIFHCLFCLSLFLSPTSLLCICLSMSYSHCISSILSDFVCLSCRSFVLPTSVLSLLCLSLSLFPLLRSLLCICLSL